MSKHPLWSGKQKKEYARLYLGYLLSLIPYSFNQRFLFQITA